MRFIFCMVHCIFVLSTSGCAKSTKIGYIKIKLYREIKGKVKTCTIKREGEQWYAVFTGEYEFDPAMTFHPSSASCPKICPCGGTRVRTVAPNWTVTTTRR